LARYCARSREISRMTDDLSVEAKGTREVPVLELKGELDLASAELLETAVERLVPLGMRLALSAICRR
jgi:hypothetical protein